MSKMANPRWMEWIKPEKLTLLEGWARDGLTNEQIAKNIGVTERTLYKWLIEDEKHPERSQIIHALKKGKEVVDFEVENALLKSAKGFYVEEADDYYERSEDGFLVLVRRKVTKRYVPANTTAQIFWLKNRKSDVWREKREVVLEDTDENTGVVLIPEVMEEVKDE